MGGAPESVSSSDAGERFGEYLVGRDVLGPADLELALSMLPHYNGKLGDTLVALGLLRPLDVFRLLSEQVRDRVIDVFAWTEGTFAFYRGRHQPPGELPARPRHVRDPGRRRGQPAGRAARAALRSRCSTTARSPRGRGRVAARGVPDRPDAARGAGDARRRADPARLDGTSSATRDERLTFLRSLYLLVETDLAELD